MIEKNRTSEYAAKEKKGFAKSKPLGSGKVMKIDHGSEKIVEDIFEKWDLNCEIIGEVIEEIHEFCKTL